MKLIRFAAPLVACLALAAPAEAQKPRLPVNGGFETQDPNVPGYPYGWFATILPDYADFVTFESDESVFHGGQRSVQISIHEDHPTAQIFYNWGQVVQNLKPGHTYRLTAYVRTENVQTSPLIFLGFYNTQDQTIGGASTADNSRNDVTGTSDWKRVKVRFTFPAATTTVVLRAILPTTDNEGARARFDDVKITPL
jgi:hypothetical protein